MNDDDLYPADGEYFNAFKEPIDQAIERKRERAEVLKAQDELKAMIKRLDDRIAFYEKTTSISDEVRLDPQQFLIMHNSYDLTAKTLRSEKEYLEELISTNIRKS